jgi:hypothetical protein
LGERFGRYWRGELRRGPSRSKDALRMTARTDNGKSRSRFPSGMTNEKCKCRSRFPSGMTNEKCKCRSRFPSGMTNKGAGLSIRGVRRNWRKGVYGCRFSTGAGVFRRGGWVRIIWRSRVRFASGTVEEDEDCRAAIEFGLKGTNGKVTCDRGIAGQGEDDQ